MAADEISAPSTVRKGKREGAPMINGSPRRKDAAPRSTLRDAQKSFTRSRIRDAAMAMFHDIGYHNTTIDQIATLAGASRQTFYQHFPDKEGVLNEIMGAYYPRVAAQLQKLAGPRPEMSEINAWMADWSRFVARERDTILLMMEINAAALARPELPHGTVRGLIDALARTMPAFAAAQRGDAVGLEARVRGELVLWTMTWTTRVVIQNPGTAYASTAMTVMADAIHAFLHDPRFA